MNRFVQVFFILLLLLIPYQVIAVTIVETQIIGNNFVPDKELYNLLTFQNGSDFNYQTANQSVQNIQKFYQSKGYRFVNVKPIEAIPLDVDQIKIVIRIEESPLNTISEITFTGNYAIKDLIFTEMLAQQDLFIDDIAKIKQLIIDQYSSRGYFFTEVSVDNIVETDSGAIINFRIIENKPFQHKFFKFKGNRVSKDYSLIKISRLNRGQLVTPQLIKQGENRIAAKNYIKSCSINPIDYETLLVNIKEGKMTTISGIAGYNSKNSDYPFSGFLDFSFNNLFGSDRRLQFKWNKLQENRTDLALAYHDSGLKDYYFSADFDVKRTEYDTVATLSELGFSLNYDFVNHDIGIYTKYISYDVISSSSQEEAEQISALGVFWQQNFFDHQNNPRSGYQARFSIDYNMSSQDKSNYNISQGYLAYAYSIKPKFVLYNKFNAKYSTKKDLTSYNSFKLGGFTSLRGFQEEQFAGYFTSWNNLELRYLFGLDNNLFIFGDLGYLETASAGETTKIGHLYSLGLGLRTATILGNLTFEYALGYNDGWNSLYDGLIHFGLETSF